MAPTVVRAHQDPSTCNHAGVFLELFVFRGDGTTVVSATDTLSPCETIVYRVRLSKPSDPTFCAFEAGRIFITTPDGVQHDVTPTNGVPCVGGTTAPCDPTVTFVDSQPLSFTINQASGQAGANASYGLPCDGVCGADSFCGTAHNSPSDLANVLSASTATAVTIAPCGESPVCQRTFCDPQATDGVRTGLCVTENLGDSQTDPRCTDTDGTLCTKPGCEAGVCVQAHIPPPSCPACQECKADTGRCGSICPPNQCCNPNTLRCLPAGARRCRG